MDRVILHCDLNNFYASAECLDKPYLRNMPMIVGGSAEKRHGIVLAKNEIAKKAGIKTGDTLWQARQKIADLEIVPPNFELYSELSKQVFNIYTRYTCFVEAFGPDECWLDVTGSQKLFGDGVRIADTLRDVVYKETKGLTISVGVSFNKSLSKLASDMKKPNGTTLISKENFKEKIWHLPTGELFNIGRKTADKLLHMNIKTVGQLAIADESVLKTTFGINGLKIKQMALGLENEPVMEYVSSHTPKSVGHGMTTTRDVSDLDDAVSLIYYLTDMVASRMRKGKLKGNGVSLSVRFNDLTVIGKQSRLKSPTRNATDIGVAAVELLKQIWTLKPPIRTLTVSVYDVSDENDAVQMTMFDDAAAKKHDSLDVALDKIRTKYGYTSIKRANLIERDFVYDKTEAEDFLPFKRQ